MNNNNLAFITLLLLIICSACNKYDDFIPEFEVTEITASQSTLIESFSVLTNNNTSACKLILDKQEIPDLLCQILINAKRGSEVVFLVDATGSMSDDIDEVKKNINEILDCLPEGVRLAAATYGDNRAEPSSWFSAIELTEDVDSIRAFVNAITVFGGGDLPESVFDAIWKALDEFAWKDCKSPDTIIVMGDAEPKVGTDTDHSAEDVLAKADSLCSNAVFVPVIILDL